jgi:hypothetical protein
VELYLHSPTCLNGTVLGTTSFYLYEITAGKKHGRKMSRRNYGKMERDGYAWLLRDPHKSRNAEGKRRRKLQSTESLTAHTS